MEKVRDLVEQLDEAAWDIAQAKLDEQSWTILGARVVELIDRAERMLAFADRPGGDAGPAICWARTDPPVVLARAFGTVHRRLVAMAQLPLPVRGSGFAA
jgi:hypothetical protein